MISKSNAIKLNQDRFLALIFSFYLILFHSKNSFGGETPSFNVLSFLPLSPFYLFTTFLEDYL
jgi:hypothetical protein